MHKEDGELVTIAEADFNLSNYHKPNQLTDKVNLSPVEDPCLFQIVEGEDHVEVSIKTIELGASDTPGSTMSRPTDAAANARNNRNSYSGRRG